MNNEADILRYSGIVIPNIQEGEFLFKQAVLFHLNYIKRNLDKESLKIALRVETLSVGKQVAEHIPFTLGSIFDRLVKYNIWVNKQK